MFTLLVVEILEFASKHEARLRALQMRGGEHLQARIGSRPRHRSLLLLFLFDLKELLDSIVSPGHLSDERLTKSRRRYTKTQT